MDSRLIYLMSLSRLFDVMSGDYDSFLLSFHHVHQVGPNALPEKRINANCWSENS